MLNEKANDDVVRNYELLQIKWLREHMKERRAAMEALARDLRERERDVIARIEAGVPIDGHAVVVTRRRQNISWLTVVRRELGEEAVIKAKDEWPVAFYLELQIG